MSLKIIDCLTFVASVHVHPYPKTSQHIPTKSKHCTTHSTHKKNKKNKKPPTQRSCTIAINPIKM